MEKLAAIALSFNLACAASEKHQILGQMNEVDEDNNVVSDSTFWGETKTSSDAKVKLVRSILVWVLTIVILLAVAFLLYRVYLWYKSTKSDGKKPRGSGVP